MNKYLLIIILLMTSRFCLLRSQPVSISEEYTNLNGFNSAMLSGPLQKRYNFKYEGSFYIYSDIYQKGILSYNNTLFHEVLINLNSYEDELIIRRDLSDYERVLDRKSVDYFFLGHRFFISYHENNPYKITPGYYEVIYMGRDTVLKRNKKMLTEAMAYDKDIKVFKFTDNIIYHVLKDGKSHIIKTEKDVINLYIERKKEIKSFLRNRGLIFRRDGDVFLIETLKYLE